MQKDQWQAHELNRSADSSRKCTVCFQSFNMAADNVKLPCGHSSTCARCWGLYVVARLDDGQAAQIQCTEPGCSMPLPLAEAKKVVPLR